MGGIMVDLLRDHPQDFELDDAVPAAKTRWHGSSVGVTARLVPRYLWTTSSIDVFLDGRCILRTGGQMKIVGSSSAEFRHDGVVHTVELSWDRVQQQGSIRCCFPYQLRIDGAKLAASEVAVENAGLLVIPMLVLASAFLFGLLVSDL
jgi:hypothetical protein